MVQSAERSQFNLDNRDRFDFHNFPEEALVIFGSLRQLLPIIKLFVVRTANKRHVGLFEWIICRLQSNKNNMLLTERVAYAL